ncbi:MAG: 2OG-Fe dioxygenase family protein [Prochloraceae cyanobacterium]
MNTALERSESTYNVSFGLKKINSIKFSEFRNFFSDLPVDPYIKGKYRQRRLSQFQIKEERLIKLPHGYLFQSRDYNPIVGDIKREFAELAPELIALDEFKKLLFEFSNYCQLKPEASIGVHQIRTICSPDNFGNPAPEGIHRDGCDYIAIVSIDRENIKGGETHLYLNKQEKPIFKKVLNPGELLLLNDREHFHFTTPVKPVADGVGKRDVFVITSPSLILAF